VFLLDTDILSLLHVGHATIEAHIRRNLSLPIATTVVSQGEILRARFEFLLKASNAAELVKAQSWVTSSLLFLKGMIIVPVDKRAAENFDSLRSQPGLRRIGRADLLIATNAQASGAVVVSRNVKDFGRVPRLKVINWANN
jgi:tRNA(fMet)-specific endonuclease VapC